MRLLRHTPINNNKGMSIAEVMLSVVVTAFVVLLFLQWVHFFSTTTSTVNKNENIDNVMIRISEAFGSEDKYCNYILSNFTGNPNPQPNIRLTMAYPQGYQVDSIDFHDQAGAILSNVVKRGSQIDNNAELRMNDIRLRPVSQIDATTIVANLEFTFQKQNAFGPPVMKRRLPIYATINPANGFVRTCSTSANSKVLLQSFLCEVNSDGFSHYDVETGECIDNDGVDWYYGATPFTATCPAGTRIARANVGVIKPSDGVCLAEGTQGVDLTPRTYLSGYIAQGASYRSWEASLDNPPKTCTFVYVKTVNPASFKSRIKCIKL